MALSLSPWKLREAARCFNDGGLIAYPTEAVYGLGCDPLNQQSMEHLLQLKQRPIEKGVILIAADYEQLIPFIKPLDDDHMKPVWDSWPGPNTWLLPAADNLPFWLTGIHQTLAVRVTAHPLASALCRACDSPLVSTSANRSGQHPATSALQVHQRLGDGVNYIISGPLGDSLRPSTIRDALSGRVIRG
ncbi:L-threonylcarbamoyladenylate synthase [Sedimenticola selenatireducens]|jgi:L-threonylcarbamoyladenylate synthase|uniref:Threonylcarbamoyl-AMP synthase n=1 Tax=Sedimenticola selenatireducens TaxID=191960 RepID=A0A557SHS7_9GAMM|nr:Sua5/YciO/YrdC/YwlC family protein [Sedimenticola selenatireducens]TVO76922.1 tRNA threonylcarbamoyladenosine biosynthesis protein RimN [Sedimenticola selenatireducens]TVT64365.1 MAG: tRNA threonylcarbamoyladenosine biosynthesis protein RimN [Sedimenticola selenatireducens]